MAGRETHRWPPALRCAWLFLPGAERDILSAATSCGADVLIQELEDFTPPERRPEARALAAELYPAWRAAGRLAAVRINPLETEGSADLDGVMPGRPDIVLMSKVAEPAQVAALEAEVEKHERRLGIRIGSTELVPNIESARGIMQTYAIAKASRRITGVMGSTEDMAADLGAPRSREGTELAYARQRLHLECTAAGVVSIDGPYTFADVEGARADARFARRLGYLAKSAVDAAHVTAINEAMVPSPAEIREARALVLAFEAARAAGKERVRRGDLLVEVPTYMSARRLIERAAAFGLDEA